MHQKQLYNQISSQRAGRNPHAFWCKFAIWAAILADDKQIHKKEQVNVLKGSKII